MDKTAAIAMVVGMGLYQGCNPPMAWLPAVGVGLRDGSVRSLLSATGRMALGHYFAMISSLIPLALLLSWGIVTAGGLMTVLGLSLGLFGVVKLVRPRHPSILVRVNPRRLTKWSYLNSFVHCGAPLMVLMPFFMLVAPFESLCSSGKGTQIVVSLAFGVPAIEVATLFLVATCIGLLVWGIFGLKHLSRVWVNFDFGMAIIFLAMSCMALTMSRAEMDMSPLFG